jgi:folate-binding protein YgfZ
MRFMMRVEVSLVTDELAVAWRPRSSSSTGAEAPYADYELVPRDQLTAYAEAAGPACGLWAFEALRIARGEPRLGLDTDHKTIPNEAGWIGPAVHLDKGCYRGQETVARVHNLGKPPRMLVLLHLDGSTDRPATGDPVLAGGRTVGRLGTVVDHVDEGPIALALLKRGLPADTALTTGGETEVAAVIDPESLPPTDEVGAGRLAVEQLRGRAR